MELKAPSKKGYKTPPYRPPLPILHESLEGLYADEYDWPVFTGYYNGTNVIVDDRLGISVLTNKGFFGKGSLSKGCPNLGKRRFPRNIVFESQWKRRKQWMESLSNLLKINEKSAVESSSESQIPIPVDEEERSSKNNSNNIDKISNDVIKTSKADCAQFTVMIKKSPDNPETESNEIDKLTKFDLDVKNVETPSTETTEAGDFKKQGHVMDVTLSSEEQKEVPINDLTLESRSTQDEQAICSRHNDECDCKTMTCSSSCETRKITLNTDEVLVISDVGNDLEHYFSNLNPHIEEEKIKTVVEVLYLSLEEAFFLCYACNCLQILDLYSNILGRRDAWNLFRNSQTNFTEKYVAYHHFRSKGWVVKSGIKFGGDFLLYKKGPLYFHASYIVIVDVCKNNSSVKNKVTWDKIFGISRMAGTANKEILICHITWPTSEVEKLNDPSILKEFCVTETLLRKWQATQEVVSSKVEKIGFT